MQAEATEASGFASEPEASAHDSERMPHTWTVTFTIGGGTNPKPDWLAGRLWAPKAQPSPSELRTVDRAIFRSKRPAVTLMPGRCL